VFVGVENVVHSLVGKKERLNQKDGVGNVAHFCDFCVPCYCGSNMVPGQLFLGAFAKLRKATVSFVMSVHPSARPPAWNSPDSTGRIFIEFIFEDLWKLCQENPFFIKI